MQSPFPGMDPYLEQVWPDIHARLILYACDQLEEQLPSSLIARVEERVVLQARDEKPRGVYPDVKITERRGRGATNGASPSNVAVMEPVIIECEETTETFIQILEAGPEQRLVTVIEILSSSNKLADKGRRECELKQSELREAGVTLVEIDLLRAGPWVLNAPSGLVLPYHWAHYYVCVRRGWRPNAYEVYPILLQSRLPVIKVPLREQDPDVHLDLQAVLDQAYRKGRYHLTIDYSRPPDPPLDKADVRWARTLLGALRKKRN